MIAQAMRAILLATATATSLAGFLASSLMTQGCFCGCCRACRTTAVAPMSLLGGNNYWPSSFSARTRILYIPSVSNCSTITIDREKHNQERGWNGGQAQTSERWESDLIAADPTSGEVKGSAHLRYSNFSGTLATAGGLVFIG